MPYAPYRPHRRRYGSHPHDWYVILGLAVVAEGLVVALSML